MAQKGFKRSLMAERGEAIKEAWLRTALRGRGRLVRPIPVSS